MKTVNNTVNAVDVDALRWPQEVLKDKWLDTREGLQHWVERKSGQKGLEYLPSCVVCDLVREGPTFNKLMVEDKEVFPYQLYAPRYLTRLFRDEHGGFWGVIYFGENAVQRGTKHVHHMALACAMDNLMSVACHVEMSRVVFTLDLTMQAVSSIPIGQMLLIHIQIVERGKRMRVIGEVRASSNSSTDSDTLVFSITGNFFLSDLPPPDSREFLPMYAKQEIAANALPSRIPVQLEFGTHPASLQLRHRFSLKGLTELSPLSIEEKAWDFGFARRLTIDSFFSRASQAPRGIETLSIIHFTVYSTGVPPRINGGATVTAMEQACREHLRTRGGTFTLDCVEIQYKKPVWVDTVALATVKEKTENDQVIVLEVELVASKVAQQESWDDDKVVLTAKATISYRITSLLHRL